MSRLAKKGDKVVFFGAQRDGNEKEIIEALEEAGASVQRINESGVPDLLVWYNGKYYLIEVKMPGRTLNPRQVAWHSSWQGDTHIAKSVKDALSIIKEEF